MTQFWRHYRRSAIRRNWVTLLMKAAVRAAENSRYAILLCCDQKFKPSHSICMLNLTSSTHSRQKWVIFFHFLLIEVNIIKWTPIEIDIITHNSNLVKNSETYALQFFWQGNKMDLDQIPICYIKTAQVYSVTARGLGQDPSRCFDRWEISQNTTNCNILLWKNPVQNNKISTF